ncbi:MAG TPA: efflux RND transporter periplasmic adaptor subunit [Planctomycetaceae bacterium]
MSRIWWGCLCAGIFYAYAAATAWPGGGAQPGTAKGATKGDTVKGDAAKADSGTPKSGRPISCDGPCQIKLMEEAVLAFERPGILGAIDVQEGDLVKSTQFLAKLKDDVARAAVDVAEATAEASDVEIKYTIVAAEVAQTEVDRMEKANLKLANTVPDLEVQRAKLNATKTALEVEKARHTRDINVLKTGEASAQLATYRLEAPFDGFVSRVHLTKGASVKQGDPVIKLVSTRKLKVEGQVSVRDAALLQPGAKVNVTPILPEAAGAAAPKTYPGKLVFIDVESTAVRGTVRIWAEVDNVDNMLRAGLTATMTILPAKGD